MSSPEFSSDSPTLTATERRNQCYCSLVSLFSHGGKEPNITWEQTMGVKKEKTDKKYSTNNETLLTIGISFHQIAALPVKKKQKFPFSFHLIFDDSLMVSM